MKTIFKKSFIKDLKKYERNKTLLSKIQEIILEVEAAESIRSIKNLKKLKEETYYYRIKVGHYRIGLIIKNKTVIFVRMLHRKDIYRYFP